MEKNRPYRSRVGRIRYGFMVKQTTMDAVRRHATDLEMSYGGFIEWAIEDKIKELNQHK